MTRLPAWTGCPRSRRRRLLHVAPVLWSGAGRVIAHLCGHQARRDEVAILTSGRTGAERDWPIYRSQLTRANVAYGRVECLSRDPSALWASVERLAALLGRWRPSVVHTHAGVPACLVAHSRALAGVPCRHVAQMYSWNPTRPEWMNRMDAWGCSQADVTICSAVDYVDLLTARGVPRDRIVLFPWGVRLDEAGRRPGGHAAGERRIGFVGRVEPRKGQLELVEAVGRLRTRWPGLRLDLVGPEADPAYAGKVREAVARLGIGDRVTLHGYVDDVGRIRAGWDAFVSLSNDEGQGLAVLEAMAQRIPVLAVDAPGVRDYLVNGRTGLLLPARRPALVARAIDLALSSPLQASRLASNGQALVKRRFSWDRCLASIEAAYRAS